jgi:hypothetical protein
MNEWKYVRPSLVGNDVELGDTGLPFELKWVEDDPFSGGVTVHPLPGGPVEMTLHRTLVGGWSTNPWPTGTGDALFFEFRQAESARRAEDARSEVREVWKLMIGLAFVESAFFGLVLGYFFPSVVFGLAASLLPTIAAVNAAKQSLNSKPITAGARPDFPGGIKVGAFSGIVLGMVLSFLATVATQSESRMILVFPILVAIPVCSMLGVLSRARRWSSKGR